MKKEPELIESLWIMIMSSPALLLVMWEMFPDHAVLLRTEYNTYGFLRKAIYQDGFWIQYSRSRRPLDLSEHFEK